LNDQLADLQKLSFRYIKETEFLANSLVIERKALDTSRHAIATINSEISTKQTEIENSAAEIKRTADSLEELKKTHVDVDHSIDVLRRNLTLEQAHVRAKNNELE